MIVRPRRRVQRSLTALAATSALFIGGTALAGGALAAAPTFEPDSNSAGSVALYDANGARLTSGSTTTHPFATYYAGSGGAIAGSNGGAQAYAATPQDGVNSNNWSNDSLSASTRFGTSFSANYPGSLKNSPNAIAKATPDDFSLDDYIGEYPAASTQNPNVYQIRVYTGSPTKYYTMDVQVTGKTWTQVYPAVASATATSTTVTASPTSPSTVGTNVTFTAAVSPSAAAGSVQFKDGTVNLGSPVAVSNGTATYSTTTLSAGSHSITAAFTPTDSSAYSASTSPAYTYVVNAAPAAATTTTLRVSPTSPASAGTQETLTANVSPTAAAGSVQFKDGSTNIGSAVAVTNGVASTTTTLSAGTHSLTAVFTPTDTAAYQGSTSAVTTYVVNAGAVTSTTTTLAVTPEGPSSDGTVQTLTATVKPSAATGTVQFKDGTTDIGSPVTVSGGTASTTVTLAPGAHSLTAVFTPADSTVYAASTSDAVTYSVNAATTSVSITTPKSSPYGKVFAVSTVLTKARTKAPIANALVQLFRKAAGQTTYTLAKTVTTDSSGAASFSLVGTANTIFQWRYAGTATQQAANSTLAATTVTQIVSVARTPATFKRGGTVKLYGAVSPATIGQTVYFQSFVNNKWTTQLATKIAKQKMPDGRTFVGYQFAARLTKPGAYGFRSYAPPTSTLGGTVSAPLPVRVT